MKALARIVSRKRNADASSREQAAAIEPAAVMLVGGVQLGGDERIPAHEKIRVLEEELAESREQLDEYAAKVIELEQRLRAVEGAGQSLSGSSQVDSAEPSALPRATVRQAANTAATPTCGNRAAAAGWDAEEGRLWLPVTLFITPV